MYIDMDMLLVYSDSQPSSVELSKLPADDVDTVIEQVLVKRGLNEGDTLRNLKSKFDVCKVVHVIP